MVSAFPMQSYYRPAPLSVDTSTNNQKLFDDESNSVLDDNILDQNALDSGLELSPPMADSRRESLNAGPPLFSPKTDDWQSVDMQSLPSGNPFLDQHNGNSFLHLDQSGDGSYGASNNGWPMTHGPSSGGGTPLQQLEALPADFEGVSIFSGPMQTHTPFTNPGNPFASLGSSGSSSVQKDWSQAMAKKMASGSGLRSHHDLRRGDGIRKKNARFEIPAERTLNNIDQLIASSTDEQEIKELKQQKRLLRNRQAALDSRQRKKIHTERLEDEKKHFNAVLGTLEDEILDLKTKMDQLLLEKQSYIEYIEGASLEKEEMIRAHTIETGELRKKVGVLTEHVQRLESSSVPGGASGSAGFSDPVDDINDMNMNSSWDNPNFFDDFAMDETPIKQEHAVVPVKKTENVLASEGEKGNTQGGLLFMLFLVGAFVMSNRNTQPLPRVSEDVRVASATLLENVLNDAGVQHHSASLAASAPQPSGTGWQRATQGISASNDVHMNGVAPSMLSELSDGLMRPTEEQTHEQIFSISPAQFNGLSDHDFLQNIPERSTSQGRKNLADALATMRATDKQNGAAEVYTRSLLWDQIPSEVVQNFAKMVAECNNAQNDQQQCNEAR